MGKVNKKREAFYISAFTLVETTIALVILVSSFMVSLMIFLNISKTTKDFEKIKYEAFAERYIILVKREKNFINSSTVTDSVIILKKVSSYHNIDGLLLLEVEILKLDNTSICKIREIVNESS